MNPIDDAKAEVFRQESWLEGPESVFLAFGGMQGEVLDNVRALVTDHDAEGGVQPEVLGVRATLELLEGKTAIPWSWMLGDPAEGAVHRIRRRSR